MFALCEKWAIIHVCPEARDHLLVYKYGMTSGSEVCEVHTLGQWHFSSIYHLTYNHDYSSP